MKKFIPLLVAAMLMSLSCQSPKPAPPAKPIDYSQELPPGTDALRKLSPDQYPDFSAAATAFNLARLDKAIDNSLHYLAKPGSEKAYPVGEITHDRAVASLQALRALIDTELQSPSPDARRFDAAIRSQFDVYQSVGALDPNTGRYTGDVLFTAYFTPTYLASTTRTGPYQYPLYKRPADLVSNADGTDVYRKMPDGSRGAPLTRDKIENQHALDGNEFVYLQNRFEAYIVTIQGSARLQMTDGRILEVGNNGTNGLPYISPGKQMLADGVITKDQLTLQGLKNYFAQNPAAMDHYLALNPREVFFTERKGGPFGSLDEPVTAFATIATDKTVFPRAMPVFVVAPLPNREGNLQTFRGLMLDQDTGGAIRSAGRCDIYMGLGEQAGKELNVGQLYYLAIK